MVRVFNIYFKGVKTIFVKEFIYIYKLKIIKKSKSGYEPPCQNVTSTLNLQYLKQGRSQKFNRGGEVKTIYFHKNLKINIHLVLSKWQQ